MFAEPQNITISAGSRVTTRVLTGSEVGRFIAPERDTVIEVSHSAKNRLRSVVKLQTKKFSADPTVPAVRDQVIQLTINRPNVGFSEAETLADVKGLLSWLSAGTDANLKKFIGGEN